MRLPWAALLAVAVLAACTEPPVPEPPPPPVIEPEEPRPATGLTVGVVLPPEADLDAATVAMLEADVRRVGSMAGSALRSLKVLTPPQGPFHGDLVGVLADGGTDVVCALGPDAKRAVLAEAELHPELRYCATPVDAGSELPEQAVGIEVRAEELGFVVGSAARVAAAGAPVGLVLGSSELPAARFREGLDHGLAGAEVIEGGGTPEEAVVSVLEDGAAVVIVDAGPGSAAAAALAAASVPVLVPAQLLTEESTARGAVLSWRVRWDRVLWPAVQRHLGVDDPGPTSHGFAEVAFLVTPGPAASLTTRQVVDDAVQAVLERPSLPDGRPGPGLPEPPQPPGQPPVGLPETDDEPTQDEDGAPRDGADRPEAGAVPP